MGPDRHESRSRGEATVTENLAGENGVDEAPRGGKAFMVAADGSDVRGLGLGLFGRDKTHENIPKWPR